MLRFVVTEVGRPPLPAVHLEGPRIAIGSAADARIRLPAAVARDHHLEVEADRWRALAEVVVDGAPRAAGAGGAIGDGVVFELGSYRVRVEPAPEGAEASPPQRTESLARELVRSLLGAGAAPTLHIERGPGSGASRALPPPEAVVVIGRGDEAGWVILDEDLSRSHVEVRRGWDGVVIRDLGSKNGTRVDGADVPDGGDAVELHDGALLELGNVALRFRDPAERHLRGPSAGTGPGASSSWTGAAGAGASGAGASGASPGASASQRAGASPAVPWLALAALLVAVLAVAGLIWVLAS